MTEVDQKIDQKTGRAEPLSDFASAPTRPLTRRLVRCVPAVHFMRSAKATSYLYTSGRANRVNPAGVDCLYFSEDEATANEEYLQGFPGPDDQVQPKLTFHAEVALKAILDLEDPATLRALDLTPTDLRNPWRTAPEPTQLQELGRRVAAQTTIAAIRYPSAARAKIGEVGWNVALFPRSLAVGDRIRIRGEKGTVLEQLPGKGGRLVIGPVEAPRGAERSGHEKRS